MGKDRHVPIRMCAGCRERRPKAELTRLVLNRDSRLVVDMEKVLPGRGVYICPCRSCLELAIKKKGFVRGFRRQFRQIVPQEVVSVFREEGEWQK
jgi:predicted RNA-binding protein YlxR (DUF448 family)